MAEEKKFRALDHECAKEEPVVEQEAEQVVINKQKSKELIYIKDSEDVTVRTTDTQASVSLQLGLQAAIVAVISISIGSNDDDRSSAVIQEFDQLIKTKQVNFQKTVVESSKCVTIITQDIDVSINIQALLQLLIAVVVKLDIL